jgi:S-adenosylmethionine:tRNA ribosyltransferase-isomerase
VLETVASGGPISPGEGWTDIFIYPPYRFRAVDALVTNFHLPGSTLLALVYAFGGTELMRQAYRTAIDEGYRFFSYGDAMLIV